MTLRIAQPLLGFTLLVLMAMTVSYAVGRSEPAAQLEEPAISYEKQIIPLLKKYCYDCHGDQKRPRGDLKLSVFVTNIQAAKAKPIWKDVRAALVSEDMPPSSRPQPSQKERETLLFWLTQILTEKDLAGARDPGRPILRRFTRLEYNNTVRDLLGLETDVFMFPERLPFRKNYCDPASGKMPVEFELSAIQYGARFPALLKQSSLPGDNRAEHGFSNRGDALNLSPLLLEKYLAVAAEILKTPALPDVVTEHRQLLAHLRGDATPINPDLNQRMRFQTAKEFAANNNVPKMAGSTDLTQLRKQLSDAVRNESGVIFNAETKGRATTVAAGSVLSVGKGSDQTVEVIADRPLWLASFSSVDPVSGSMILTNKGKGEKKFSLKLAAKTGKKVEGISDLALVVLGRAGQKGRVILTAELSSGQQLQQSQDLSAGRGAANTLFTFKAPKGQAITRLVIDGSEFSGDYVVLDDLAFITASVDASTLPAETKVNHTRETFRQHLKPYLARALRRPVSEAKVDQYLRPYDSARKLGLPHAQAARASLTAVLASPEFLYLVEAVEPEKSPVRRLSDHELATRLSYFLWSSMPDRELTDLADQGQLQSPEVLEQQVRRMLKDKKARELTDSFAVQWLHLNELWAARPDRKQFAKYYYGPTGTLAQDMMAEAVLLFETVHIEDRSILDFLDARYTYLNQRLIKHYQMDAETLRLVGSDEQRAIVLGKNRNNRWFRVQLPDRRRGGFLASGAILTLTSLPQRTSPVKRGAWVLEAIFDRPPPPPNVAVEPLDANPKEDAGKTVRQKLEAHRTQASCISCHAKIDPPGFALEHFDAVGRWRERDGDFAVDASGVLPDGRKFADLMEFKDLILARKQEFVRGFTEHLLSYALGRKLEHYDEETVDQIGQAVAADDYRFSRVVVEVAKSYPFRHVRNFVGETK